MRRNLLIAALAGATLLLAACAAPAQVVSGPAGPVGPAGPQGPIGPAGPVGPTGPSAAEYVGTEKCAGCHKPIADVYAKSGHAFSLQAVKDEKAPQYPFSGAVALPEGYAWKDIAYVIGGYAWKAVFVDKNGYIITDKPGATVSDTTYANQYNLPNKALGKDAGWASYHAGEGKLAFTCGACHTTGYKANGHQDKAEGVVGTWASTGTQCEACHGPGSLHAKNPYGSVMRVNRDASACTRCHARGGVNDVIATPDGFVQHDGAHGDLGQSKHLLLDCVVCHNPHTGVVQAQQAKQAATKIECASCHFKEAQYQKNPKHRGMDCVSCHMPNLGVVAWSDAAKFSGDIRTHLMAIDAAQANQVGADGKLHPQIALNTACRSCHGEALPEDMLLAMAQGYHTPPAATATPAKP